MIRNFFVFFLVVLAVGGTSAAAQNYFIKKSDGETAGQPLLYNQIPQKPQNLFGGGSYKALYKDKLKVKKQKISSLAKAGSLAEIYELGLKPRDAEELMFYAQAHRAVTQNAVYKRREALMEHLEKKSQRQEMQLASQQADRIRAQKDKHKGAAQGIVKTSASFKKKSGGAASKTKLFVKPGQGTDKPTKVFTGYR